MQTSYEVGAVFRIADHATPTLAKLASELQKLERLAISVKTAFDGIGKLKVPGLTGDFSKLSKELTAVGDKAIVAEKALAGVGKTGTVIGAAAREAGLLQKELAAAVKEGNALSRIRPPNLNPGAGAGGRHVRPGQGHGSHRAGEVGLQLGILGGIGTHQVGHFLKDALKDANELEHIRQQMYLGGLDRDIHTGHKGQVDKATSAAWREGRKYGLPVSGVLADIKELALPFGSVDHAIEFIEPLEKMKVVLNAMSEGKGTEARDAVYKMARAGELKGLTEAKDFNSYFDSMTKAITASGGKITPNSFAQVTQYGKLASFGWNEEFYTKYLPTLMQTMNPSTAGQSLMSLYQTMGGVMKGTAIDKMDELGLIGDRSKVKWDPKTGRAKSALDRGFIKGTDVFTRNPLEWARDYLLPALEKKYGDLNNAENKERAIGAMGTLFGNRNSAAAAAELALRLKSFERDHAMIGQAQGTGAATGLADKDPVTAMNRLQGSWTNFMTMLGGPGVQAAISAMNSLSDALGAITKWGNENPAAMKTVLGGLVGLGAALAALTVAGVIAGAVLLGPGGAVAVAITTVIGVISGIVAVNWEAVKGGFKVAMDYIKEGMEWWSNFGAKIREKIGLGQGAPSGGNGPGEGVVPSRIPMGYDGPTFGGGAGIIKAAFSTGGEVQAGSADERFAKCVYVGVLAALKDFGGAGGGGGFGGGFGGAGIHKASLGGAGGFTGGFGGTFSGKALAVGAGTGIGHTASRAERAAYIRAQAAALGMDPEIALRVAQSEGFNQYVGDQGRSFGDWQLFTGGGLGNQALAAGINIRDPGTWKAQTDFALKYAKQHGWGSWYGAGRVGIGRYQGINGAVSDAGVVNGELRVKGGLNGQATAGGGSASGLLQFAEQLQKGGGVNRFTAFNDRYHAGTGSMHARGLAADVTGDPQKIMANARAMMEAAGLQEGRDFKMINEYQHRSRRWTGGHVHFQFQTPEAAAAYAAAQRNSVPPTAGAPPKPKEGKMVSIPVHIGGHKVAHVMTRIMTAHATFPTSAGNMDSRGQLRSPGTTLTDTA